METIDPGAALIPLALHGMRAYAAVLLDRDGTIVGWNAGAERMLGYPAAAALGRSFTMLYLPQDLEADRPGHELREAAGIGSSTDDNWLVRQDGTRLFASGLTEALRDDAGALAGYIKVFRDVSDRRRVEEALRARADELAESDRRKERFLSMLSHELRSPMAPLRNAVELLERHHAGSDDTAARALAVVARQTRQLARLVDDVLDVTHVGTGRALLRRERVDLVAIAGAAADRAETELARRDVAFVRTLPDVPLHVEGDPDRLRQILANLLDNAAKFTDAGGTVTLELERTPGGHASVRVRDTGIGIVADLVGQVFEPFVQEDRELGRSQGGIGLGLALAHRLATLHSGPLRARSAGPGRGSEFELELPLIGSGRELDPPADEAQASVAPGAIVVLVVDDNVDGADSIAMLLGMRGHPVHVAYNGQDALELAAAVHPDVVLLDIGLPSIDGYEVARRLRAAHGQHCVLAAITGYGTPADRARAFESGFDHHLLKPVEPEQLDAMLDDAGRRLARG